MVRQRCGPAENRFQRQLVLFVIARSEATKQSSLSWAVDCFAALAMTGLLLCIPLSFYMICIMSYQTGASMADQSVATIDTAPIPEVSSNFLQITVLAVLAATGTLATNILLPSLPQMAASLKVSSAAVTSAITLFLALFALRQLVVGPISDLYGRRWPGLTGFAGFLAGRIWWGLATCLPSLLAGRVGLAA